MLLFLHVDSIPQVIAFFYFEQEKAYTTSLIGTYMSYANFTWCQYLYESYNYIPILCVRITWIIQVQVKVRYLHVKVLDVCEMFVQILVTSTPGINQVNTLLWGNNLQELNWLIQESDLGKHSNGAWIKYINSLNVL